MEYEYKVRNFEAQVTTADVRKKTAGDRVCAQLELLLQETAREGWELQGQYQFSVTVQPGCFDGILRLIGMGSEGGTFLIYQLVFRKPM
jgi:hypothetical protein